MNILHITPYVPSVKASHAGGVCMGKQAEWLSDNHDYHLLTFVNSKEEEGLLDELRCDAHSVRSNKALMALRALVHPRLPLLFSVRSSVAFAIKLIYLVKRCKIDAIHAEYTAMGQYVWVKKFFPGLFFNLTEHDVTQQSFERKDCCGSGLSAFFNRSQLKKVRRSEKKYVESSDVVFSFSRKDCRLIESLYATRKKPMWLAPYYGVEAESVATEHVPEPIVCFIGQMGRSENSEAALRLISLFRKSRLNEIAKLRIIGANPTSELLELQGRDVEVTGFVEDINACIQECRVAAFPLLHGAGIKLKVLLAASLGLPVVTTDVGAEGIDEKGECLIVENDDEAFIGEVRRLLADEGYYILKRDSIKAFVENNFSWSKSERVFEVFYSKG